MTDMFMASDGHVYVFGSNGDEVSSIAGGYPAVPIDPSSMELVAGMEADGTFPEVIIVEDHYEI